MAGGRSMCICVGAYIIGLCWVELSLFLSFCKYCLLEVYLEWNLEVWSWFCSSNNICLELLRTDPWWIGLSTVDISCIHFPVIGEHRMFLVTMESMCSCAIGSLVLYTILL